MSADTSITPRHLVQAARNAMFGPLGYASAYNAVTLTVFSAATDAYFPWRTSPLTAAAVGAAYAGALALCLAAVRATRWVSVRAVVPPALLVPVLVTVACVLERRSLRLGGGPAIAFVASYLWFLIHAALIIAIGAALLVQWRRRRDAPAEGRGRAVLPWPVRAPLIGVGGLVAAAGAALFAFPRCAGWWPWPLTPIDARVLGALALAYGIGVLLSVREADLWSIAPGLASIAVAGPLAVLAVARYPAAVSGTGLAAYLLVLAVLTAAGVVGLAAGGPWRSRRV